MTYHPYKHLHIKIYREPDAPCIREAISDDGSRRRVPREASRGTRLRDPSLDIASRMRGASGSVFIIWYNPFPKRILNTFYHWEATNYWDISNNKPWTPGTDRYRVVNVSAMFVFDPDSSLLRFTSLPAQSVRQNHQFAGFRLLTDWVTHEQCTFILPRVRPSRYLS